MSRLMAAAVVFCFISLLSAFTASASAELLPDGTQVRVVVTGTGDSAWRLGQVRKLNGCRMIFLAKPTREGYTSVMVQAAARMQVQQGGAWVAIEPSSVLKTEPAKCSEDAAD